LALKQFIQKFVSKNSYRICQVTARDSHAPPTPNHVTPEVDRKPELRPSPINAGAISPTSQFLTRY
jgi:hypothetical protein